MGERRLGHSSRQHPELIEAEIAAQAAEIAKLVGDNKRLASSHTVLGEELSKAKHEALRLKAHTRSLRAEAELQLRVLAEKSLRAEAVVTAGETARNHLAKAIRDAQGIVSDRHQLTAKIQQVNEKLHTARNDIKSLPGLRSELDTLTKEHQRHRSTFEYEKGSNMEQVEELEEMEQKLILMAEEIEMVRRAIGRQHSMKAEYAANADEAAASASSGAGKCQRSNTPL